MGAEPEKITAAHPNVLPVTGPQQYESVLAAVHQASPPQHDPYTDLIPPEGIKLTPRHYAYLKISEGCNNRCTFCIIPHLRGDESVNDGVDGDQGEAADDGPREHPAFEQRLDRLLQ
jgi:ribosomal protein S12 methylthiotransferase